MIILLYICFQSGFSLHKIFWRLNKIDSLENSELCVNFSDWTILGYLYVVCYSMKYSYLKLNMQGNIWFQYRQVVLPTSESLHKARLWYEMSKEYLCIYLFFSMLGKALTKHCASISFFKSVFDTTVFLYMCFRSNCVNKT